MIILIITYSIIWYILCAVKLKYFLHMMQIEGYKNERYIEWINFHKNNAFSRNDKFFIILTTVFSLIYLILPNSIINKSYLIMALFLAGAIVLLLINVKEKYYSKKPLVFTMRAKRLYIIILFLVVIDFLITLVLVYLISKNLLVYFNICAYILSLMYYASAYYLILANNIAAPIEKKINKKYYEMASDKINQMNIISIGITGSYGKTSTKFFTAAILSQKYKVLYTPESYNTPMGISKVINNDLNDDYDVFLAELGATKSGDIDELALLTGPKIGIITSIGPCHLETFKSIDNIMRTKYELIEKLPNDGTAIFNYDNEYVKKLADKTFKEKILYGIDNIEDTDIFATNIKVGSKGSTFTLCVSDLGTVECATKLLGKHNILNILAGVSVAKVLGISLEDMAKGISRIESVEHRLQLIDPGTGVLVIDDAFNSNPDGAQAALDVLDSFKDKRKIIITPGMVELGAIEEEENKKFGENIARICDIVILVGRKRTVPIYNGLINYKFNKSNVYVVNSLKEASDTLGKITKANDVVLFENDLPDTYNEK